MESALLPVFRALRAADVDYLVVGGVAVVLHGHLRVTGDLDLVLHLAEENVRRAMQALAGLVFTLWSPHGDGMQIDVFAQEPFDFASARARAEHIEIDDAVIAVASISDLVAMKRIAGRAKDTDDIVALERIAKMRRSDG
ncbi:MAG: hypothetical protein KIT84_41600 [Labilithrix sp.]|nr:hypothetical protein [Labilithrix sp.]MCW5817568.1 hypothetical protein [Labilithrix sp.]